MKQLTEGPILSVPLATLRHMTTEERFWSKVNRRGADECWPWLAAKLSTGGGYGAFRLSGKTLRAHRLAFKLANGYWPINALHKCDNPPCCNPAHLFDGSMADNTNDMKAKGRMAVGEALPQAKLTAEAVRSIRRRVAAGESQAAIAREYGVRASAISRAANGVRWAWL